MTLQIQGSGFGGLLGIFLLLHFSFSGLWHTNFIVFRAYALIAWHVHLLISQTTCGGTSLLFCARSPGSHREVSSLYFPSIWTGFPLAVRQMLGTSRMFRTRSAVSKYAVHFFPWLCLMYAGECAFWLCCKTLYSDCSQLAESVNVASQYFWQLN